MNEKSTPSCSRIKKLIEDIEAQKKNTVEEFWKEINKTGTPLIEEIEGDVKNFLVTFVARNDDDGGNCAIYHSGASKDLSENVFDRVCNTNIYYKSYKILKGSRLFYMIIKNNPLSPHNFFENWKLHKATFHRDEFNDKTFVSTKDEDYYFENPGHNEDEVYSLLELPAAPASPYLECRQGVPAGELQKHKIKSKLLDNERLAWIYTPSGYSSENKPYNMLLLFDGWGYKAVNVQAILDNLIYEKKIPPTVAVLLGNAPGRRNEELPCNDSFTEFIATELIPWTRNNFNVTVNPEEIIVGGFSFGGLASSYLALRHSEIFGNVLSQSGSYWWSPKEEEEKEWLIRQYVSKDKLPINFYLDVGKYESFEAMVVTNRHFRDVLKCKNYTLTYSEFKGEHAIVSWMHTLADGLIALTENS